MVGWGRKVKDIDSDVVYYQDEEENKVRRTLEVVEGGGWFHIENYIPNLGSYMILLHSDSLHNTYDPLL